MYCSKSQSHFPDSANKSGKILASYNALFNIQKIEGMSECCQKFVNLRNFKIVYAHFVNYGTCLNHADPRPEHELKSGGGGYTQVCALK